MRQRGSCGNRCVFPAVNAFSRLDPPSGSPTFTLLLIALGITMTLESIVKETSTGWMYLIPPLLAITFYLRQRAGVLEIRTIARIAPQLLEGDT